MSRFREKVRPNVWAARTALKALGNADAALVEAMGATADRFVSDSCQDARKIIAGTRRRAEAVLKDLALREAPQPELDL